MLCDLCRMNLQNVHTSLLVRKRDFCKQKQSNKRHFVVLQVQAFSSPRSLRIIACIAGVSQKHENEKKLRASAHPLTTSPRFFAHSRPARLFDLSFRFDNRCSGTKSIETNTPHLYLFEFRCVLGCALKVRKHRKGFESFRIRVKFSCNFHVSMGV